MTTSALLDQLEHDEGFSLQAYQDTKGLWTIGVGHHDPSIHAGMVWTHEQVDTQLLADVTTIEREMDHFMPWWRKLNDVRQDVMINLGFMGIGTFITFTTFLEYVASGEYALAASDLLNTKWARDVGPGRSGRCANHMRTGT